MTDIRKAAKEGYPTDPNRSSVYNGEQVAAQSIFIKGAEWMREQAAREVEHSAKSIIKSSPEVAQALWEVAASIRKIGASDD